MKPPENPERRTVLLSSLDDPALVARNPDIEHERRVAIFDLIGAIISVSLAEKPAPSVRLSLSERGIRFDISVLTTPSWKLLIFPPNHFAAY